MIARPCAASPTGAAGSVGAVTRRRPAAVVAAFAPWTVFVWGTRIRNVVGDDGSSALDLAVAVLLTAAGLAVAVLLARRSPGLPVAVRALAVVTWLVWAVRAVAIATGGHGAAFVAVHLVLAAVSAALAAAAWSAQSHLRRRNTTASTTVSTTISARAKG